MEAARDVRCIAVAAGGVARSEPSPPVPLSVRLQGALLKGLLAVLSDGQPRRGMSVVAALSAWLVHTNPRGNGSWTQRYERGIPVTDLAVVADDGTTGTTVTSDPTLL